jgi:rhodanese-related sulfurtransferase
MPNDPFVDIAALPSLGPVHYLDARDRVTFDAGHAPGAAHVSVEEWDKAAKVADIGFAKTAYWDEALASLGVSPSAIAVAYDDGRMTNASATAPAVGISRVPGTCRIPICWTMALCVRHRLCEPCWSGWDSARETTS